MGNLYEIIALHSVENTTMKTTPKQTNPILKAKEMGNSRRFAINAMCANCMGCTVSSIEQGFRNNIKNCTSTQCPLYSFRPYQVDDSDDEECIVVVEEMA